MQPPKPELTLPKLVEEASALSAAESLRSEPDLYGVTDGKTVGTYIEQKFRKFLADRYEFVQGNSASGIDFPDLGVDTKTTSITQPQSSCPFKSAQQKIYGLGYALIVFVYEKADDHAAKTGRLTIRHTVYVEKHRTADFQMTTGIRRILENNGNVDDLLGFFTEKNLPVDDITARNLAEEVLANPPEIGYLTISNALQWRLQYTRVIDEAGKVDGIIRVT